MAKKTKDNKVDSSAEESNKEASEVTEPEPVKEMTIVEALDNRLIDTNDYLLNYSKLTAASPGLAARLYPSGEVLIVKNQSVILHYLRILAGADEAEPKE